MQTGRCLYVLPIKLHFECWILQWNLVNRVFVHRTFETSHEADLVWNSNLVLDSIKHLKRKDFLSFCSKDKELLCDAAAECRVFWVVFCFICFWVKFRFPALICVPCFVALVSLMSCFLWRGRFRDILCSGSYQAYLQQCHPCRSFGLLVVDSVSQNANIKPNERSKSFRSHETMWQKQNLSLQESKGSSSF